MLPMVRGLLGEQTYGVIEFLFIIIYKLGFEFGKLEMMRQRQELGNIFHEAARFQMEKKRHFQSVIGNECVVFLHFDLRLLATSDVLGRSVKALCKQERVAAALRAAQASSFVEVSN